MCGLNVNKRALVAIAGSSLLVSACSSRYFEPAELADYYGEFTLEGAGPPDRGPLTGTLTLKDGGYVLTTSLGKCGRQKLEVPKPVFDVEGLGTYSPPTTLRCGDLRMSLMLRDGQVPGVAGGFYPFEKRLSLGRVCTLYPQDSMASARGEFCVREREDFETIVSERSYRITITRRN
jgi:hypothetical protein